MTAVENQYKALDNGHMDISPNSRFLKLYVNFFSYPLALICLTEIIKVTISTLKQVHTRTYHPCNGPGWSPVDCGQLKTTDSKSITGLKS